MDSKYHPYQNTVPGKDGKERTYTYVWWMEEGKRRKTSLGAGSMTRVQIRQAIADLELEDQARAAKRARDGEARLRDLASTMFHADSEHVKRNAGKGRPVKAITLTNHRQRLENHILPRFGEYAPCDITEIEVEDWLLGIDLTNSWKNNCLDTLRIVMHEAKRLRMIPAVPEFERFAKNARRQDVLSDKELEALFPIDSEMLEKVWALTPGKAKAATKDKKAERAKPGDKDKRAGRMFGTLFCLAVSAGLRSGEVRNATLGQLSVKRSGFIVDRAYDTEMDSGPLKKGTDEDPRYRVVVIPERTVKMVSEWAKFAKITDKDALLFSYCGKPISANYLNKRYKVGLEQAGIKTEGRKLSVHGLRYTWVTKMRRLIPQGALLSFSGHLSEAMTDHYTRAQLDASLEQYQGLRGDVERFWGKPEPKKLPAPKKKITARK